jgi:4-hydroxybenzoate polyprenyltransferase
MTVKDLINRPNKSMLDRLVSQNKTISLFYLKFYRRFYSANCSWRALFFFSSYIFLIWFYSHKIKNIPLSKPNSCNISSRSIFAILLHYYFNLSFEEIENHLAVIFSHASFLFLLLLVRNDKRLREHERRFK